MKKNKKRKERKSRVVQTVIKGRWQFWQVYKCTRTAKIRLYLMICYEGIVNKLPRVNSLARKSKLSHVSTKTLGNFHSSSLRSGLYRLFLLNYDLIFFFFVPCIKGSYNYFTFQLKSYLFDWYNYKEFC